MVKVALTGGLGNQMFQYAFARNIAVKNKSSLCLNTSYLQSKLPFKNLATQMRYELDIFNIHAQISHNFFQSKYAYPFAKIEHILKDLWNSKKLNEVRESHFHFQPALLHTKDNCYIKGNFQSHKYFIEIEDVIRNDFSFKNKLTNENLAWQHQIENSNAVSIHFRRGDYITLKQNVNKFAQIPFSYYQNAIQHIAEKIENPVFFIFTDDVHWIKSNFTTEFPYYIVENNNTATTNYLDMQLMSKCKHNIICNSTFSWWAAWLNANKNKIVIAPNRWFTDDKINSNDIYPSDWIKL